MALACSPLTYRSLHYLAELAGDFSAPKKRLWLALDGITDVHNFGAICRSAAFFGAEGVVVGEKKHPPLNSSVCKTSAGAIEHIDACQALSMFSFLHQSRRHGWSIVAAQKHQYDRPLQSVSKPTVLVMGSEDTGISRQIQVICDDFLWIPNAQQSQMNSLNVSVAAAVLLAKLL